jgi:hypothetical protein
MIASICIAALAFVLGVVVGRRWGRKEMREELFRSIIFQKFNAVAVRLKPVVAVDNEFASGARLTMRVILAEVGLGYLE